MAAYYRRQRSNVEPRRLRRMNVAHAAYTHYNVSHWFRLRCHANVHKVIICTCAGVLCDCVWVRLCVCVRVSVSASCLCCSTTQIIARQRSHNCQQRQQKWLFKNRHKQTTTATTTTLYLINKTTLYVLLHTDRERGRQTRTLAHCCNFVEILSGRRATTTARTLNGQKVSVLQHTPWIFI